jgi:hypothetical protein
MSLFVEFFWVQTESARIFEKKLRSRCNYLILAGIFQSVTNKIEIEFKYIIMRKLILSATLLFAVVLSWAGTLDNGLFVSKSHSVQQFSRLLIEGEFEVYLHYGLKAGLRVEATQATMDRILVDQDGETLAVRTSSVPGAAPEKAVLHITIDQLVQLSAKDVQSMEAVGPIWFDNLQVFIQSHGKTNLNLIGNSLQLNTTGAGDVHLKGTIKEVLVNNQGIGTIVTEDLCIGRLVFAQFKQSPFEVKLGENGAMRLQQRAAKSSDVRS